MAEALRAEMVPLRKRLAVVPGGGWDEVEDEEPPQAAREAEREAAMTSRASFECVVFIVGVLRGGVSTEMTPGVREAGQTRKACPTAAGQGVT
jgi:hypothetical protein